MTKKLTNLELQQKMDIQKWLDSETRHMDMCGHYDYCGYCNKYEETPCANAYERLMAEKNSFDTYANKKFNIEKVMQKKANRKSLTFIEKYTLSSDIVKERYAKMKDALLEPVKGKPVIKSRISKQCDTYRRDGEIIAKITILGTSLRINLKLDVNDPRFCDGTMPHYSTGHKHCYEMVPFQFKVNSKLALKRALILIETIKNS